MDTPKQFDPERLERAHRLMEWITLILLGTGAIAITAWFTSRPTLFYITSAVCTLLTGPFVIGMMVRGGSRSGSYLPVWVLLCVIGALLAHKFRLKSAKRAQKKTEVKLAATREALAVGELIAPGRGISDLSGLERCPGLWKLDLRDNDIRDATLLRELPRLHWLDLRGNKNLETFDVTGCSQYFDHCAFELTDFLRYYTFRQQAGVTTTSDPCCLHSVHLLDQRESTDWTHHGRWHAVREHTRGEGIPIVFSGIGYLDVDIADGSFGRLMEDAMGLFFEGYETIAAYLDWFDVYYVDWILPDRNSGCVTWEEYVANGCDMIGIPSREGLGLL